jgi:hypothetical protein
MLSCVGRRPWCLRAVTFLWISSDSTWCPAADRRRTITVDASLVSTDA